MASSRQHVAAQGIQRAMRAALRQAAISKPATPHSLRHYAESRLCRTRHRRDFFATHLLENGYGIRTGHESLGHVATTMIYGHVLKRSGRTVRSRLDALR
jgi:site-specific recombinase XerD